MSCPCKQKSKTIQSIFFFTEIGKLIVDLDYETRQEKETINDVSNPLTILI